MRPSKLGWRNATHRKIGSGPDLTKVCSDRPDRRGEEDVCPGSLARNSPFALASSVGDRSSRHAACRHAAAEISVAVLTTWLRAQQQGFPWGLALTSSTAAPTIAQKCESSMS